MSPHDPEDEGGVEIDEREACIKELLTICAEQQVSVPSRIRATLLGEEQEEPEEKEERRRLLDSCLELRASEVAQEEESPLLKDIKGLFEKLKRTSSPCELRITDGSYTVTNYFDANEITVGHHTDEENQNKPKVDTVLTKAPAASFVQKCIMFLKTGKFTFRKTAVESVLLTGANLRFETGKMYLVLGAPGAGKSTLLKYIADKLRKDKSHVREGTVSLNGVTLGDKGVLWPSLVTFIDQIDRLHPYLTVEETLQFAFNCRQSGTHEQPWYDMDDPDMKATIDKLNEENFTVSKTMEGLGLTRVKDTFVGDNVKVRGVSGGEKKRVTVAEMMVIGNPVLCCDEISTGLDAATTYDICKLMSEIGRLNGTIRIVSLLQPPPETVAIFDEIILVDSGRVIYSGPVDEVVAHFESLGYVLPERMDVADWLQALPTRDGKSFLKDPDAPHLSTEEFQKKFDESDLAQDIKEKSSEPFADDGMKEELINMSSAQYRNPWHKSMRLLASREMLLWWRDKYQIKARVAQDLLLGIFAGTLFWQQGDVPLSVFGILCQSMFFISLGAMSKVGPQFETRSIFYKHQDAHFFPTWSYVIGRSLAAIPTGLIDAAVFGTILYFFVGLSYNQGATIANYFVFMLMVLSVSICAGLVFSIFSSAIKDRPTSEACMSVLVIVLILFSGFTVQADVIPVYWIWIYWSNFFAWVLRSVMVNEFQSGKWDEVLPNGYTEGENILVTFGFTFRGEPFWYSWVWYGFAFAIVISLFSIVLSTWFLKHWRYETGLPLGIVDSSDEEKGEEEDVPPVDIPFQKVNLTFRDMHYTVTASTSKEKLELLKGVDGILEAGKMTALMGSSGAGKSTLMDVLALRKSTGEIEGEVCLNGHPQESGSFRRCTGYVEQFDEQQPELTIHETVTFSAKLRLQEADPAVTPESTNAFIEQTLEMLELTDIQYLQVGTDLTGGLSFEEKKRLSIAVELVANPSIIFLDEPTSGLDARSASIVMRGLKRIADTGRSVCATIHQPSIAIFNSFDSLLLLKRGGEVVYFGDLGEESSELINYLERFEATPKIQAGENPATWMLTTIGAGSKTATGQVFDYAGSYASSKLRENNLAMIDKICEEASEENRVSFPGKYAASRKTQWKAVLIRVLQIYWRSPSYNLVRLLVSLIVSVLFGSVYVSQRVPENESDMNSRVTSIFITFIFLAVNAFNTVLPVFEVIRNMFYRHKAAVMYDSTSLVVSLTVAEIPFIILAGFIFVVPFYFMIGFALDAAKFFWYYFFFTMNLALFTFLGQLLMSCFRDSETAQGFGGVIISLTSLFSGVLIRPNEIPTFWVFAYWLLPGHYVLEGMLTTQYYNDDTPIEANEGGKFWNDLGCEDSPCYGTAEAWVQSSFNGYFSIENLDVDIIYMCCVTFAVRLFTFIALMKFNFLTK